MENRLLSRERSPIRTLFFKRRCEILLDHLFEASRTLRADTFRREERFRRALRRLRRFVAVVIVVINF